MAAASQDSPTRPAAGPEGIRALQSFYTAMDAATREATEPDEVLRAITTALGEHLGAQRVVYADYEYSTGLITVIGSYNSGVPAITGTHVHAHWGACHAEHMLSGRTFVYSDVNRDERFADSIEAFRAVNVAAGICVPIFKDGRFATNFSVHSSEPRQWTPEELDLTISVAYRCWEAVTRARLLQDLRLYEHRLRIAQQAAGMGVFDWYIPEGRVIVTPELNTIYGRGPGGLDGTFEGWARLVVPEDAVRVTALIQDAIASHTEDITYEFRAMLPDGDHRWLHSRARLFYDQSGRAVRMLGINMDIHTRRMAEEKLIRTEKLAAVGRLASSIAHEINNPLGAVTNLLYLARLSDDLEDVRTYLATAETELARASAITTQTLGFHRQSSNAIDVDLDQLLAEVLNIYGSRIRRANVTVEHRIGIKRKFRGFGGEIRQVLSNLVGNAVDAMTPQGGRLIIRSRAGTHPASGVPGIFFTVADTGAGMSAATQRKLFQPFFTTKGDVGTGLGLWVSKEILTRHGGDLRVRSRQSPGNAGSVFTAFIPLKTLTPSLGTSGKHKTA